MSFESAIRRLNQLKQRRVLRDYALIGAVAATVYMEPVLTEDMDIVVLVGSDEEYLAVFRRVGTLADGVDGMHHLFDEVPVQIFPSTMKPLYEDAVRKARRARIGNVRVSVASAEHLVIMALEAFRPKDKLRLLSLLQIADNDQVRALLREFDDAQNTLAERLQTIRRSGV